MVQPQKSRRRGRGSHSVCSHLTDRVGRYPEPETVDGYDGIYHGFIKKDEKYFSATALEDGVSRRAESNPRSKEARIWANADF